MKTMKPRKIALAGTVVAAVALVGCLGCAAQTQTADTGAAQEPVQQEQPGQEPAAPFTRRERSGHKLPVSLPSVHYAY